MQIFSPLAAQMHTLLLEVPYVLHMFKNVAGAELPNTRSVVEKWTTSALHWVSFIFLVDPNLLVVSVVAFLT